MDDIVQRLRRRAESWERDGELAPDEQQPRKSERLHVVPCELREANEYIEQNHRHHKPVQGHRFSLKCVSENGRIVGVITVGRPVARLSGHPSEVLEVTRCCTDGTPNAVSALYGAAARAGKAMGYKRIQTYTLPEEGGGSMRAAGWVFDGGAGGGQWKHTDGKPRRTDQPMGTKHRWVKHLNEPFAIPAQAKTDSQPH